MQASIFCAAQFVTSYGWGVFSDKYGRKPVLLMSIVSGAVSALIFGMAGNYLTAALARLAGGLLNATGGCAPPLHARGREVLMLTCMPWLMMPDRDVP